MLSWTHFVTVSDMSRRQSRETQRLEHRLVVLLASPPAFGLWIRALFRPAAGLVWALKAHCYRMCGSKSSLNKYMVGFK